MYNEMMDTIGLVNSVDPELGAAMDRELTRQRQNIELIASENIVSPAVMAAMGSILTNKYAEGLPGKRYYGGCVYVDEVENIAIQRACKLFGAKYANVQPHSGAQANLAVYFALLDLGDTVMGMDLSQGGHLTHGSPVNMSGKNYHFVSYGVNADGVIDYVELEKQVKKVRPKLIVAGASAYPRAIDFEKIAEIAHGYGAYLMVDMAHIAGLVAGGQHQSPVPYADVVTTTTHKTLRGPRGGLILTNKYAEGLPGKRYYGGCAYVDGGEKIALQRACKLFGAKYANVQPHSGAQANLAVYFALLDLGDTVMGMDLSQGGHLTHGSPVNMSGKNYHFVSYGVNADGVIDYAALEKQVRTVRPKLIVAGASAYPRAIDFEKLAEIAHGYGAYLMVDMAHIAGLVAGGYHQSPVPYADVVTTTTHKTLRGPRGGLILTNNAVLAKRINSAVFPGTQGGPLEHVIAAKAVCFGEALKPEFKEYARKIVENAQAMAAELQARGVKLVSGGTDNHLMLLDLREEECTGKELEARLDSVHITANKNTVPGETRSPFVTSGVRLGTPAVTTRGMGPAEMKIIADCIADCIWHYDEKRDDISARVLALTKAFPLYE